MGSRGRVGGRRSRRERNRRLGRAFERVGYCVLLLAGLVGFRALLDAQGHDESVATLPPRTPVTERPRTPAVAPRIEVDPIAVILGEDREAGDVGTGEPGGPDTSAFQTFRYRVSGRDYTLTGLRPALRPTVNHQPVLDVPGTVFRSATGTTAVRGVVIGDQDDQGADVGILIVAPGEHLVLGNHPGVQFLGRQYDSWLAFSGTVQEVNAALAGLTLESGDGRGTLTVVVSDFGHGDLDAELHTVREISVQ